jgi:hypothetical protein
VGSSPVSDTNNLRYLESYFPIFAPDIWEYAGANGITRGDSGSIAIGVSLRTVAMAEESAMAEKHSNADSLSTEVDVSTFHYDDGSNIAASIFRA